MAKINAVIKDDNGYSIHFTCDICKRGLYAYKESQVPPVFGRQCELCGSLTRVTASDVAGFLLEEALNETS